MSLEGPSTRSPRVTALVVTYNGRDYVRQCLSTLAQATEGSLSICVIDNNSTDGTPALVRSEFPDICVLEAGNNLGYGAANNQGALEVTSKFLAILNQDAVSAPGWIDALIAALEQDPAAGLATPKVILAQDQARLNTCGNSPHYTGITVCRGYNLPADRYAQQEYVGAVSGAALVISRELFNRLGGFDPSFFMYLEDTDLSLRAALAGYRSLYVPTGTVYHSFRPTFSAAKIFQLERNRYAMLLKLLRWRTLALLIPALLLTEVAVWGYALLRGPRCAWTKASAYGAALRDLPGVLARRRQTQALRRISDRTLLMNLTPDLHLVELGGLAGVWEGLVNPLFRGWYRLATTVMTW